MSEVEAPESAAPETDDPAGAAPPDGPDVDAASSAGPTENGEAAEESRPVDDDAQKNATSNDTAAQWGQLGIDVDEALRGLLGRYGTIGANVFIGSTVGSVGNNYHDGARVADATMVGGGPLPQSALESLRQSYVQPSQYEDLLVSLRSNSLVVLRGRPGTGRSATAIHALDRECKDRVCRLDPETDPKTLSASSFEENTGYLLDSANVDAAVLTGYHLERLTALLDDQASRLVIVTDAVVKLRLTEIDRLVVDGIGAVEPGEVVRRHLTWALRGIASSAAELLDREDVVALLDELPADTPPRELALLARGLADLAAGSVELDTVRQRFFRVNDATFQTWFAEQQDLAQRAFVIALAVFNGESVQLVTSAARLLFTEFQAVEVPRRVDRARPVFGVSTEERVATAEAEWLESSVTTQFGDIPVSCLRYRDDRRPRQVLEHVCAQHDEAHRVIRKWLLELGVLPGSKVHVRAGAAAGLLSLTQFSSFAAEVIVPWAESDDKDARAAAVTALQIPVRDPQLAPVVHKMLRTWLRTESKPSLQATAALALSLTNTIGARDLLRLLWRPADTTYYDRALPIAQAIRQLFLSPDNTNAVLSALVRWTEPNQLPGRQQTALLALLVLSSHLVIEVDDGAETWPVLIWIADRAIADGDGADPRAELVLLFSRLLDAPGFLRAGYRQIRRWLREAQRDKGLRRALGDFLGDLVAAERAAGDTTIAETLHDYLTRWATGRKPPIDAINDVLVQLHDKGH